MGTILLNILASREGKPEWFYICLMCYHAKVPDKGILENSNFGKGYEIIGDYERYFHANAFDHPKFPTITTLEPRMIQPAEWGLVPYQKIAPEKAKELQKFTINAIGEELFIKKSFKHLAGTNRCIIIVEGFYEWMHVGSGKSAVKYPFYMQPADDEFFYFGGIWNEWRGGLTSVVITTAANPLMEKIHNSKKRMPFILRRDQIDTWLSDIKPEQISSMIHPFDETKMKSHTISRTLNQFQRQETNIPEISDYVDYPELAEGNSSSSSLLKA